jgi:hypothetical protein
MAQKPQVEEHAVPVLYLDLDGTVREGKDDALGRFVNGGANFIDDEGFGRP